MTATRLEKSKELTKDMERKVIVFGFQKNWKIFIFTKIFNFSSKNYIFLEKCKIYISPSIYVNLECKFLRKCKSMENVNLQIFQP